MINRITNQSRRVGRVLPAAFLAFAFALYLPDQVKAQQWTNSGNNIFYNAGKVGVGTNSPSGNSLHVFANDVAVHNDLFGMNQPAGLAFDVQTAAGAAPAGGAYQGLNGTFLVKYNPGGTMSGNFNGLRSVIKIDPTVSTSYSGAVNGINGQAWHYGGGTMANINATRSTTKNVGSGVITDARGMSGGVGIQGPGGITRGIAAYAESPFFTGTGILTTAYGLYADIQKVPGVGTGYGLYQAGAVDLNYFAGRVGIGTPAPAYMLDVSGGPFHAAFNTQSLPASSPEGGLVVTWNRTSGSAEVNFYNVYNNAGMAFQFSQKTGPNAASDLMTIVSNGNVGIGTVAPAARLDVFGAAIVSGNLTSGSISVNGDVVATGNIAAKYQDIAEWVPATHQMPAGTVVVLDPEHSNQVVPSTHSYDTRVAGVISDRPGLILGERSDTKVMVATTGRVRVKVDATSAPINVGDLLVTSKKAGIAMRSEPLSLGGTPIHRPGTLIGKALEPLEKGTGEILVLLSLQ